MIDKDALGPILGRMPSGIFILTAGDGNGRETGMLASWVQQASFEPPAVTVAVNSKRYLNDWLKEAPRLALNLIGESQKHLLGHFGRGFEPDEPAFDGLDVARTEAGLPLLSDALGFMEGEVADSMEAGDHVVYLVRLTAGAAGADFDASRPMVHIRKSGFHY